MLARSFFKIFSLSLLVCAFAAQAESSSANPSDAYFTARTAQFGPYSLPYWIFKSPKVANEKNLPVILYLHASGERGTDGIHTYQGLGKALREHPERFPAIAILPQMPKDKVWSDKIDSANSDSPTFEEISMTILEQTLTEETADRSRVYLTGNSLGGFATWELAAKYASVFAAAIPISGGCSHIEDTPPLLVNLPIWAAHGRLDQDVKFSDDEAMVNAVRAAGNKTIQFKAFRFHFHNVWDSFYGDKKIIRWLFAQHHS